MVTAQDARAEAERRHHARNDNGGYNTHGAIWREGFIDGAVWARAAMLAEVREGIRALTEGWSI